MSFTFPLILNRNGVSGILDATSSPTLASLPSTASSAIILTQDEGGRSSGLYLFDSKAWRYALPEKVLDKAIIKGYDITLYWAYKSDFIVEGPMILYRNGVLMPGTTITSGTGVYASVNLGSGLVAGVNTLNELSGNISILPGNRIDIENTSVGVEVSFTDDATDEGTYN